MKSVPQSNQQLLGFPLKETYRRNAIRNVSVLLSVTSSRWTSTTTTTTTQQQQQQQVYFKLNIAYKACARN